MPTATLERPAPRATATGPGTAPTPAPLVPDALDPIGLDDLNAAAAMLARVDRKYVLTRDEAAEVAARLHPGTRVLQIGRVRAHSYESVYFDTPGLDAFRMTASPRRRRFKIRTRAYLDSSLAFLEVKTRGGRGLTLKERLPYGPDDAAAARLTDEGRRWASAVLSGIGYEDRAAASLAPVLRGSYRRTTLLLAGSQGRATLDSDLSWVDLRLRERPDGPGAGRPAGRLEAPGLVIIETKSGSSPSDLDRALWRCGHRPARISKYATALAALDPSLPRNRWHRTLPRLVAA
ncbi:polyphosphate polymerase domain-containing protein [Actinomyces sp. B33]|uniref:polyphosphate polymerase domain-containing protein n=1 Tax=Actinomyces sp. B33 TaxID=2942131 RepID=UPI002341B5BF|nr:polyphosphate polymerase domain-containing protein [Actinomyces sp. B33]MDC4232454.1 polyphosphate polymerase domain-containing protein [Actinomyces sp. B33]